MRSFFVVTGMRECISGAPLSSSVANRESEIRSCQCRTFRIVLMSVEVIDGAEKPASNHQLNQPRHSYDTPGSWRCSQRNSVCPIGTKRMAKGEKP